MNAHRADSSVAPRLLNLRQVAAYLGCSYWTARDYVLAGLIPVVNLPPLRPREGDRAKTTLRRVVIDRDDLDRFIEARKQAHAPDVQSPAPSIRAHLSGASRGGVPTVCPASERTRA